MNSPAQTETPEALAGHRIGPFAVVWLPSLLLAIGPGLCVFAVNWWVSRAPDGGAQLGVIVGVSSAVSLLSVTALSGSIDRADRRVTLLRLLLGLAVPVAGLLVVIGHRPAAAAVIVAGACYLLIFTLEALYLATIETVVVDLAPTRWPSSRTALLTQLHPQVARIVAPAVAGTLVAAGALRLVPAVALAIVVLVVIAVLASRRPLDMVTARAAATARQTGEGPAGAGGRLRMVVRDAAASVQLIRSHRELRFLLGLGILTNAVVYPFYAILPVFLVESGLPSRAQAVLYGQAATAYGIGMLVGTLLLLTYGMRAGSRRALAMASIAFAAICSMLVAVTVVPRPGFVVAAMALNGALFAVLIAVGGAVWLRRTPAAIRVRVFSLRRLTVFSSIPLGTMLMGFGGAAFGYHSFVRVMVLAVLIGLGWLWLRHGRRLPRDDAATPAKTPDVRAHEAHSNQQEAL